jgi:hypothetical protein
MLKAMTAEENTTGIFSLIRREPEKTNLILKVALAAPLAIMLWHWAGAFLLPVFAVAPVTVVFILVYGLVLAFLAGRLIHAADSWQVESALQARRLLTSDSRRRINEPVAFAEPVPLALAVAESLAPPPAATPPPVYFHQAYFLLRLQDELQKARRDGRPLSVVVLDVALPGHDNDAAEKLAFEMAHIAASQSKTVSLCLQLDETQFVFSLPASDRKTAHDFLARIVQALGGYWCHCGLAVYPDDASDAETLFEEARADCEASRRGQSAGGKRGGLTALR